MLCRAASAAINTGAEEGAKRSPQHMRTQGWPHAVPSTCPQPPRCSKPVMSQSRRYRRAAAQHGWAKNHPRQNTPSCKVPAQRRALLSPCAPRHSKASAEQGTARAMGQTHGTGAQSRCQHGEAAQNAILVTFLSPRLKWL